MKHRNEKQQHFRFKFSKSLFRRPLESASFLALLKQQEKNWRGTLLAVITIAVISGFIILAALYMTSWEQKIEYSRFTTGEIVWISERTRNPDYLWHDDTFIYAHPNGSWQSVDFSKSDLHTFADSTRVTQTLSLNTQDLKSVSGIWPNSKRTAWLIRHDGKNVSFFN
ncbi:hypothetical protein PHET_01154 [Paragonimus heterotremus]|uniref:Dipeptidylpeptidase IV N-terminal domain-containing protein n=1 Tax=Paragonimus heterotremus TaxID=100268 RepID=A0A8J4TEA6_9TREM|nr:hypothetical protein PHET_01154 [Paragonimus heterotremus]